MKILQVIPFFSPKYGGTVNSTYILSRELSKEGHDVTILTTDIDKDIDYIESIEKEGVKVVYLPYVFNVALLIYSPSMKKWLHDNLKNFDVIHMHNFRSYQNNVVREYAIKYDVPYILQARGSVLPFFQKQKLKKIYDFVWGNKVLNDSKYVVALTEEEKGQYQKMGVSLNKIKIIPNGMDLSIPLSVKKGNFRKKHGITKEEKIILYLGRIDKIKGIDLLITAFSRLSWDLKNVKLVIVGPSNSYQTSLIKLTKELNIDNNVLFTGPLYNINKFEAYCDADVYTLPSRYETFPNTVLESCACGTPVILTDKCGISDLIKDSVGLVVPCEKKSLKIALVELLENDEFRNRLSNNCPEFVKNNFDLRRIVSKFVEIYNNA
jgi:glycosyltransferase involved in cell wall biosynthesis